MAYQTIVRLNGSGPGGTGLEGRGCCETEDIVAGNPVETGYNYFTDARVQLTAGVWECTAYTGEFARYPVQEFCHILSGSVDITVADGHTEAFTMGECFVIPKRHAVHASDHAEVLVIFQSKSTRGLGMDLRAARSCETNLIRC